MSLSFESRVRPSEAALFQDLDGEAVVLGFETEKYYGLNNVGTRMWTVLVESPSIEDAYRKLLSEYDVDESELRRDLLELAEKLVEAKLIRVVGPGDPC